MSKKKKKKDQIEIDLNNREKTTLSFVDYELLIQIMESTYIQGAKDGTNSTLGTMDIEMGVDVTREVIRKIMDRFFIRAPFDDSQV